MVAITPTAVKSLDAIRPAGVASEAKVFGLSESQIARRVKAIAKAAGLVDWEFFSGHSGRVGMARRMAQNGAPTHEIERQGRWKQGGGMVGRYNPRRVGRVGATVPMTIMSFHRRPLKPIWPTARSKAVIVDEVLCTLYTIIVYVVHERLE